MFVCVYIYISVKKYQSYISFFVFRGNSDCLMHFKIFIAKKDVAFFGQKKFF
jgi:hypothetical protein